VSFGELRLPRRAGNRAAREPLDEPLRHRRRKQRLAGRDQPDSEDQLIGWAVLQQETAGSGAQRLVDVLVVAERRQDQHARGQIGVFQQPSAGGDSVHVRHADVHQRNVRPGSTCGLDRLQTILGLGHDLDVGFALEDHAQSRTDHCFVVRDQDSDAHERSLSGSVARTT
jgi:hypothetical protein